MTADDLEIRRRAIRIRAWRRGMREMDILLGGFAEAKLAELDAHDIGDFERLLEVQDQQAFSWLCGTEKPPAEHDTPLLAKILEFHRHAKPVNV